MLLVHRKDQVIFPFKKVLIIETYLLKKQGFYLTEVLSSFLQP